MYFFSLLMFDCELTPHVVKQISLNLTKPLFCKCLAAKNLILAGVKSVTLHDEGTVELWDMSGNFIFSENDLGKNRALASVQKLQELNNAVTVLTLTTKLTKEQLSDFQVILSIFFIPLVLPIYSSIAPFFPTLSQRICHLPCSC